MPASRIVRVETYGIIAHPRREIPRARIRVTTRGGRNLSSRENVRYYYYYFALRSNNAQTRDAAAERVKLISAGGPSRLTNHELTIASAFLDEIPNIERERQSANQINLDYR